YHPLSPLLIDFNSAYDSLPDAVLPSSSDYPGGRDRVAYHLELAKESHKQRFHSYPFGVWPAEGGISKDFVEILAASELKWTASGEGVLAQSLRKSYPDRQLPERSEYLYRAYKVLTNKEDVICFFRDDKLSDMIGFEYAKWYGRDAAENFVHSLERIHHEVKDAEDPVVTIILDGENAWESYPYNGYYFLNDLYEMIGNHLAIKTSTFRDYLVHLKESDTEAVFLPNLAAGSWVYGNFSTWIGSHDKNLAWDILCKAKKSYDAVLKIGNLTDEEQAAAKRQLASCESSDWFWWFGDYNSSQAVASFDRLFRKNLANLYSLLKQPIPSELSEPISYGNSNARMIETMRRSN
ncbi:MAG TPA: glycoside hydrolase family 57 protein, partial [Nitrosomonas sp.]|nr:glycoside hydrolase family 57 protein [Nitrosomonas sp.]